MASEVGDALASLDATLERRDKLHRRAIDGLAHLDREMAMSLILSWFSLDELEHQVLPTLAPELRT